MRALQWLGAGSIRRRLVLQLAAVAAVLSLLFLLAVRTVALQAAEAMQDNILAASATSIADAVRASQGALLLDIPYSALSMLGAISEDRVFYRVAAEGETLTGYDDLPLGAGPRHFETLTYRGDEVRVAAIARAISLGGERVEVRVVVAQTREGLQGITGRIAGFALAIGVGFFVIAVALSIFAAEGALRPLNRLTGSVSRRGPADLRPVDRDAPTEIAPLVEALNRFMERLSASLARSEDFIAEAAHRVRTPLATVRAQAEIALRRVERPENKAALRQMIRAVDESSRSAGQLLDHAMVTFRTEHLADDAVDLVDLVRETVDRLAPLAGLKDITIDLAPTPERAEARGDRILIQNALRNILDNAIKYSPADSSVTVRLIAETGVHRVEVADQGRGFGDADLAHLAARFSRGPNVGDVVGSGLGLTIAEDVAQAHGGRLHLDRTGDGGACVSLILPRR